MMFVVAGKESTFRQTILESRTQFISYDHPISVFSFFGGILGCLDSKKMTAAKKKWSGIDCDLPEKDNRSQHTGGTDRIILNLFTCDTRTPTAPISIVTKKWHRRTRPTGGCILHRDAITPEEVTAFDLCKLAKSRDLEVYPLFTSTRVLWTRANRKQRDCQYWKALVLFSKVTDPIEFPGLVTVNTLLKDVTIENQNLKGSLSKFRPNHDNPEATIIEIRNTWFARWNRRHRQTGRQRT